MQILDILICNINEVNLGPLWTGTYTLDLGTSLDLRSVDC